MLIRTIYRYSILVVLGVLFWSSTGWTQTEQVTLLAGKFGQLYKEGRFAEAEQTAEEILSLLQKEKTGNSIDIAIALNNLGALAFAQGKLDASAKWYSQSLKMFEAVLGSGHSNIADVLYNLAGLHTSQGRYDSAAALYERSLDIRKTNFGPEDPSVADVLNNLGFLYLKQERYEAAERALSHAWQIWQRHFNVETAALAAVTLNNLGVLRSRQKGFNEAESFFKKTLTVEEKFWGKNHPEAATTRLNLAELYRSHGRNEDAIQAYEQVARALKDALGPDDPLTRQAVRQLANLRDSPDGQGDTRRMPEGTGLYQIIVVQSKVEADGLLERIRKGEEFASLAAAHSKDATAADRGFFQAKISDLREDLRRELEALAAGEVSEVFGYNRLWAIVKKVQEPPK